MAGRLHVSTASGVVRWLVGLVACAIASASCSGVSDSAIRVFAASSLTDAFAEMAVAFEASEGGVEVELVVGGSSSLREQILDGADADVFASANESVMEALSDGGAIKSPAERFAANRLVVAVPAGNPGEVDSIADLSRSELAVGLCAASVPCGAAALELVEIAGITPDADTEEPSVRALLSKLVEGELDVGIVYSSDLRAAAGEVEEVPLPDDFAVETHYVIALVDGPSQTRNFSDADAFLAFVRSAEGQAILQAHGLIPRAAS